MSCTREEALEKLLHHYDEVYYTARRSSETTPLCATAFLHCTGSRKLLSIASVGVTESDDFVYLYSTETLDAALLERCVSAAREDALSRIDPNPNHEFSLISPLFLCDRIDSAAMAQIKRTRFRQKDPKPGHGWAELRLAAVETGTGRHAANTAGKTLWTVYKTAVR